MKHVRYPQIKNSPYRERGPPQCQWSSTISRGAKCLQLTDLFLCKPETIQREQNDEILEGVREFRASPLHTAPSRYNQRFPGRICRTMVQTPTLKVWGRQAQARLRRD